MLGYKKVLSVVFMMILPSAVFPQGEDAIDMRKQQVVRDVSLYAGGVMGLSVGVLTAFGGVMFPDSDPLFKDGTDISTMLLTAAPAVVIQTLSGVLATRLFAEVFLNLRINKWLSFPAGILGGAVAGALSGSVGFAALMGTAWFTKAVDLGRADSFIKVLGFSLLGGGLWGGLSGILPGLVCGPVISFYMDF